MSERKRLCVYSHSANGQIFYVGSGEPGRRPYERHGRTPRWLSHIKRCGGYEIKNSCLGRQQSRSATDRRRDDCGSQSVVHVLKVTARNEKAPATKTAFQFVRLAPAAKAASKRLRGMMSGRLRRWLKKIITDWLKERKYLK